MFDDFETEVQCEEMFDEIEACEAMQLDLDYLESCRQTA